MQTLVLSVAVILLSMAGLATGLMLGRGPVKTSCAGLACSGLSCDTCPNKDRH